MTRDRLLAFAAVATLFVSLPHSIQPAAAADKIVIGAVGSPSTLYWPLYVGLEKGYFAAEDVAIDMIYPPSSAAVIQQLSAGSINMTVGVGLVDPIRAIDKGAPIGIVRVIIQAAPYVLVAKPAIKTIKDLKGKTVSIGGPKDITRIYLDRMIAPSGVKDSDVELVFAGSTAARFAALQSGGVDATPDRAVQFTPLPRALAILDRLITSKTSRSSAPPYTRRGPVPTSRQCKSF